VTTVDRNWEKAVEWRLVGFKMVRFMDPIVMVVNPKKMGVRCNLVGVGIERAGSFTKAFRAPEFYKVRQENAYLFGSHKFFPYMTQRWSV